jgi:hypothetical protein
VAIYNRSSVFAHAKISTESVRFKCESSPFIKSDRQTFRAAKHNNQSQKSSEQRTETTMAPTPNSQKKKRWNSSGADADQLRDDLMNKEGFRNADPKIIHESRPQYQVYNDNAFRTNLNRMKKEIDAQELMETSMNSK